MSLLKKYRTFDEILPQFLAAKQLQVGRKAYLSYTGTSSIFSRWLQGRGASYLVHSKVVDILQLKEHLRHSNLSATEHYVKRILGDKNEAIKTQFPNPLINNL